jgi:hypothetical protein
MARQRALDRVDIARGQCENDALDPFAPTAAAGTGSRRLARGSAGAVDTRSTSPTSAGRVSNCDRNHRSRARRLTGWGLAWR